MKTLRKSQPPRVCFTPAAHRAALLPENTRLVGYRYRTLNRRMEVMLTESGLICIQTARLLDAAALAYHRAEPATKTCYLRGRVLVNVIVLSPAAIDALAHFNTVIEYGTPTQQRLTALYGAAPTQP